MGRGAMKSCLTSWTTFASNSTIDLQVYPVDEFDGSMISNISPGPTVMSSVGSVGSGNGFGVCSVGMVGSVGVGVNENTAQPVSRIVTINKKHILFIVISMKKYT